jgi:beta-1,4-mannosyl-glycoprotein beta-1,4-N-acetylglucosaminyltransferase
MKIFDSFLFFQEFDLLEIRLKYLYDHVDYFIILEASQSFSGQKKIFLFDKEKERFKKFSDKIIYYKLDQFQESYHTLEVFLLHSKDPVDLRILNFIKNHNHYPKAKLNWVLDAYQREALHHVYQLHAKSHDLIMLSDLDEIPTLDFIKIVKEKLIAPSNPAFYVAEQVEFKYFLNLKADYPWYGTTAGLYEDISQISLNTLRLDSKSKRQYVAKNAILNGGYHFTSCGGEELLLSKIDNWSHQEFNFPFLKRNLLKRVSSGYDAFGKSLKRSFKKIDIETSQLFDTRFKKIIRSYNHLLLKDFYKLNFIDYLNFFLLYVVIILRRLIGRIFRFVHE